MTNIQKARYDYETSKQYIDLRYCYGAGIELGHLPELALNKALEIAQKYGLTREDMQDEY